MSSSVGIREVRLFIASSSELKDDRAAFAEMIRRRNNDWVGPPEAGEVGGLPRRDAEG